MKKYLVIAAFAAVCVSRAAVTVDVGEISEDDATGIVTVPYTLSGGSAIITFDVLTNDVPVSAGCLAYAFGDVYREVAEGVRSFRWNPVTSGIGAEFSAEDMTVRVNAISPNNPPDWMAVELSVANAVFYYPSRECVPDGITNDVYKTDRLLLRRVHAAGKSWKMGKTGSAVNPLHYVTLTNDYYIGIYEVTRAQYSRINGTMWATDAYSCNSYPDSRIRPASTIVSYTALRGTKNWPGDGHAVDDDSVLGRLRRNTGILFDLPTEAEWEFACRGGTSSDHYGTYLDICWNRSNSDVDGTGMKPQPVGKKEPNAFDLYDMIGNVWEWVLDWHEATTGRDYVVEPPGPDSGSGRQLRGGDYTRQSDVNSASYRISRGLSGELTDDTYGFRVTAPAGYAW